MLSASRGPDSHEPSHEPGDPVTTPRIRFSRLDVKILTCWFAPIGTAGFIARQNCRGALIELAIAFRQPGWEWEAFGGCSAMAGFLLASLALVAALQDNDRARQVLDANPGRALVRRIELAMWMWLIPSVMALFHYVLPGRLTQTGLIMAMGASWAALLHALLAFHHFFRRFSEPKTWEQE